MTRRRRPLKARHKQGMEDEKLADGELNPSFKSGGHRFQKGNRYGTGRPPGARNKTTLALQSLLDGEAERLTRKAVELALEGDVTALRLCLERLLPVARERKVSIPLPEVNSIEDAKAAVNAILKAVADGELTPGEARIIADLIEAQHRTALSSELQQRIEELERRFTDGR
jgi:hypothetical protein